MVAEERGDYEAVGEGEEVWEEGTPEEGPVGEAVEEEEGRVCF